MIGPSLPEHIDHVLVESFPHITAIKPASAGFSIQSTPFLNIMHSLRVHPCIYLYACGIEIQTQKKKVSRELPPPVF